MSDIRGDDLLLVERSNTVYKAQVQDIYADGYDSDLLVVERNNTVYKDTWQNIKNSGPDDGDWADYVNLADTSNNPLVGACSDLPTMFYHEAGDYTGNYRVCSTRVNVWYTSSQSMYAYQSGYATRYLYFGHKNTASTSWQGDMAIGGIQILQGDGRKFRHSGHYLGGASDWAFQNSNSHGAASWYTTTATVNAGSGTPSAPGSATTSISYGPYLRRWRRTNYTSSSWCGADNGQGEYIHQTSYGGGYTGSHFSGGGNRIFPEHNGQIAQHSPSEYAVVEWSGSSTNDIVWMRSRYRVKIFNGDQIRFTYTGGTGYTSSTGTQAAGTFWLYFWG